MVILNRSLNNLIKQKGLIPVQCISIHEKMFMAAKLLPSLLTLYKRNLQTRFVLTKSANLSNKEPLIKNLKV